METKDKKARKLKVRGVATIDPATNEFDFQPYNDGPSSQTNVKSCKSGGKSWETIGADPSLIVNLKCKKSAPDVYCELSRQFNQLTQNLKPAKPIELPIEQRVVYENDLECWLNTEKGTLTFKGTVNLLHNSNNWQAETLRLVQLIVRRLPANENFNRILKLKKKETSNE